MKIYALKGTLAFARAHRCFPFYPLKVCVEVSLYMSDRFVSTVMLCTFTGLGILVFVFAKKVPRLYLSNDSFIPYYSNIIFKRGWNCNLRVTGIGHLGSQYGARNTQRGCTRNYPIEKCEVSEVTIAQYYVFSD